MSLISLYTAKPHLRVDHCDEDALIGAYLLAAEQVAVQYLNRNVYADSAALAAAIAAAPATLTAATATYDAAVLVAEAMENETEAEIALEAAELAYAAAQNEARATHNGIVINAAITAAILLHTGHLYDSRESVSRVSMSVVPMGWDVLLQPYRVYAL